MDIEKLFEGEDSFCKIAKLYYDRNFGTMSKSEIDLLMFQILYKKTKEANGNKALNDFELARILGITSQRVQNLREKMALKYPAVESYESWKAKVLDLFKNHAYQFADGKEEVLLLVSDIMLRYSIEEFLESQFYPTEYTLNKKVILLRGPAFCALVCACCANDTQRTEIKGVIKKASEKPEEIENKIKNHSLWNSLGKPVVSELWDICKNIIINVGTNVGTAVAMKVVNGN